MQDARADTLHVGGVQRFTTIDYPGALAAVVFVQGCPWRCVYCHNDHLQTRSTPAMAWHELRGWLDRRRGRLDAIVFSGGEPTLDPALPEAMREVREMGFRIGLHTAGMLPLRLQRVLPLVDWVGLDVKAPLGDEITHQRITGARARGSGAAVRESLAMLLDAGINFECRTTAHPMQLEGDTLHRMGRELAEAGVRRYALQSCHPPEGPTAASSADGAVRLRAVADQLAPLFEHLECRTGA